MNNLFVVVDGMDGSGKGEVVKTLHNYLYSKNKRFDIMTTREPSDSSYGSKIREILKTEKDPMKNADKLFDLLIKDRDEHVNNVIKPFLSKGDFNVVICDRYYYSNMAFQQTQGISFDKIVEANSNFLKPDIAFILDVDPEKALKRIKKARDTKEKFEELEFMNKLRKNFLDLKNKLDDNIIIIDSNKTLDKVFEDIRKEIKKIIA